MNTLQSTETSGSLTSTSLMKQNHKFFNTGGVSSGNRSLGFIPGFRDSATGKVYRSRFSDGRPAPIHLLEGLPRELRMPVDTGFTQTSIVVKDSVVAGFLLEDLFYTREEAAQVVAGNRLK